jgi:uncharacterized membrane protein
VYGTVAAIALQQSAKQAARSQQPAADAHRARYAVLAGATVLASTSGYLLYLLATVFRGETCTWCLASAGLSAATLICALQGFTMR